MIRVENLLLLLGTAAFARLALRRALSPWAGTDGARASAGACALLIACHPLCVPAVAAAGARGDLLAACLGAASAALFLRGRQEKLVPETVGAGVLVLLAGHASALALLLPPLFFALELFSARRHRPLKIRLRTSATSLLVFGACASAEALTGPALGSPALLQRTLAAVLSAVASQGAGVEMRTLVADLGVIAMPVPPAMSTWPSSLESTVPFLYLVSGALLLAAFQPALVAARSAPRLWGWLAGTAGTGMLLALLVGLSAGGGDGVLSRALALFPAALIACAGFAVASTALSGLRRVLVPSALAAAFALVARTTAGSYVEASTALGELQESLASARSLHGGTATYFVVDPPGRASGLEAMEAVSPLLLDPSVCAQAERGDTVTVRGITEGALLALSREPEFEAMRQRKVVLLTSPAQPGAPGVSSALPPPEASSGVLSWRGDLMSPLFDVDPLERRSLRALAVTASTAEAPRMVWRAGESGTRTRTGVWIEGPIEGQKGEGQKGEGQKGEGPKGPVALFDLSRSTEWLFGPRAHRVWLEPSVGRVASAELLVDVPTLPGRIAPIVRDESWSFTVDPGALPRPLHGEARFVLALLDLESLRYLEVSPRATPTSARNGEIVFAITPPSGPSELRAKGPGRAPPGREPSGSAEGAPIDRFPLAWSLELRCGDVCIARASGRR
jgi:hypothetical protein